MRGRSGVLHTGHCLVAPDAEVVRRAATTVHFATVTDAEIDAYVGTGEPLAVAGAFTVDGLGGAFVRGIEGDHHNVVGISLPVLREMFAEVGVAWTDLWGAPARPERRTRRRRDAGRQGGPGWARRSGAATERKRRSLVWNLASGDAPRTSWGLRFVTCLSTPRREASVVACPLARILVCRPPTAAAW